MTRLLAVAGDGIGPEVLDPTVELLEATVDGLDVVHGDAGRQVLAEHGHPLAPDTRTLVEDERVDGVLFGATETRPGEPSAVLALREAAGSRVSVRPARARNPETPPCEVTVYRELTEGLYAQRERREDGIAHATRPITREATERFAHIALRHAPADPVPLVAHKATVLPATDGLFLDAVQDVADALETPVEPRLVDALAHDIALDPSGPATVLAPNLYGDLLSDLAAGLAGGLGLAPSLALGDGIPIAEPVHGTAPDIAGRGRANPTAALLSAAMLLDALGHEQAAWRLEVAVDRALDDPEVRPPDLDGAGTTASLVAAVRDQLGVPA